MANVKPFISLLVAIPVFSYRITHFTKICVALLTKVNVLICITLLFQTGLLIDQLASNPDSSMMFVAVGSTYRYYSNKIDKKEKENEEKNDQKIFWTEVLKKDRFGGQDTSNPHILAPAYYCR